MKLITPIIKASLGLYFITLITACAPEVGSEAWCTAMDNKPKGEWTANEIADYTKHCLLP